MVLRPSGSGAQGMSRARVQAVLVLVVMGFTLATAYAWKPSQHMADIRGKLELAQVFPQRFGDWIDDPSQPAMLVSPDLQEQINKIYNQTLSRTYVNRLTGQRIMLSVAYGGDQSDATRAHRPEVCYPAQGFRITSNSESSLDVMGRPIPVRHLVARMGGRNEPITYWLTTGDLLSVSGTQQKLNQLSFTTRGIIPDGMLVRVSNIGSDEAGSFSAHARFLQELAQAVPGQYRPRVFGAAPAQRS